MQEKKEINAFVDSDTGTLKEVLIGTKAELVALVRFKDKDGNTYYFDKFLLKKDGTPNKNTISGVRACGFKSNNFADFVSPGALEKGKEVSITIVKNDNGKIQVEFVNELGGRRDVMSTDEARGKLSGSLAALNGALSAMPSSDEENPPF